MMLSIERNSTAAANAKLRRAKKPRSTSGRAVRLSTASSAASAAAAMTRGRIAAAGEAVAFGSACSPTISAVMKAASSTRPGQSMRWRSAAAASFAPGARSRPDATSISGRLSQKLASQPSVWVRNPPTSGPRLKPSIRNPVQAPIAAGRDAAVVAPATARVPATANAAPSPCSTRPASSRAASGASAMIAEARPNSAQPAAELSRGPKRSASMPPSTMQLAEASR